MKIEVVKTFDEQHKQIGTATREDVHKLGLWHEAFHCWLVEEVAGTAYIYLQIRSENKKDFPGLLDISAAGHLTADESAADGVRELKEELGLSVIYDDLVNLGIFTYNCVRPGFTDREFAHVHLYDLPISWDEFLLPNEEVSGIVKTKYQDFYDLWLDRVAAIHVEGFMFDAAGKRICIDKMALRNEFAPHDASFYISVLQKMEEHLLKKTNERRNFNESV
ncbi:NUDIX domain-containing protein [Fictibacillus aquaticus]|uniref:Nudix hydrolase domain-containing protein n=1 Tax=Fictibacillus aquaticus TaxID=2021314 RepID=A0A235F9U1_9BACL|nr:NUDIX domain-containing protein [Fictibacillus aquaticus]OYD57844.1 hypothetical protein CGZ90_08050 [Fictibacillus aquaticus]